MPINFFEKYFNPQITNTVNEIHKHVENQRDIKASLVTLWLQLNHYYLHERRMAYSFDKGLVRAIEVYSEFLQHLVHCSYHCHEGQQHFSYAHDLVEYLLKLYFFHYTSYYNPAQPAVIVWTDALYGSTVLMNLCPNIELHLLKMSDTFGGINTQGFQNYISMSNTAKYSALHMLCHREDFDSVLFLLQTAANTFGGRDSYGFRMFLEHEDNLKRTPLNSVAIQSLPELAELLLSFGANPDIPDHQGLTARDNAPDVWEIFPPKRVIAPPVPVFLKGLFSAVNQQTTVKGCSRGDDYESKVHGEMLLPKKPITQTAASAVIQTDRPTLGA
jgi:hypothetical protein